MLNKTYCLLIIIISNFISVQAQQDTSTVSYKNILRPNDSFCLFGTDEILDISIRFDLTNYLKKNATGTSQSAIMTFYPTGGDSIVKDISISTRGTFRLQNCAMAPMEVTFKKPIFAYPDSGEVKKIKLVSVCGFYSKSDEYVLREYLVYKMYNVLTDTSFRVRLLRITYFDTKKNRKPVSVYGFFIEPKYILASRENSVVIRNMNITQKYIDFTTMDRVSIFNYMVGNWDWAVQSLHNITILKSLKYSPTDLGIAVPYDFDLTGVVDPDYNAPPSETGLKSNRDRRFMGICRQEDIFMEELKWFLARKERIYAVVDNFPYLNVRAKKEISSYLDTFFDQLERPKSLDSLVDIFVTNCMKL
jgi:hypothetical protein